MCLLQYSVFFNKYVYTTVLSFDIVAVDDEINFNSIQFKPSGATPRRSTYISEDAPISCDMHGEHL